MRAHLRNGIHEPAPAARVVALACMDDDHVDRAGRVARALVEIGRRAPHRGGVVGRSTRRWGASARCDGARAATGAHTAARQRAIDLAQVRRPAVRELDVAVPRHDRRPLFDSGAIDRGGGRIRIEQRRSGADVRHGIAFRGVHGHSGERCRAFERVAAQRHHAEPGLSSGELFRSAHHLPARLRPADRREQRRGHVEFRAGRGEQRVKGRGQGRALRLMSGDLLSGAGLHR